MFHVSVIALNVTLVIYGILFGGMHPNVDIDVKYEIQKKLESHSHFII